MGLSPISPTSAELSFRRRDEWLSVVPDVLSFTSVVMGPEPCGPSVSFISCAPTDWTPSRTHSHATDTLRVCIKGEQRQGGKGYQPGEFRFQEGWVPYAKEGYGADGMWGIILLADRRGNRARDVDPALDVTPTAMEIRANLRDLNQMSGILIDDQLSDDPAHTAGPSATVTTIGPLTNAGKLDGSFIDRRSWMAVGPHTQVVVALMGEPVSGPVVVLAATDSRSVAAPRCRFDTEVLRIVVGGSCTIEGRTYEAGDAVVHDAGSWCDAVVAGPEGLHELIVLADRRLIGVTFDRAEVDASWPAMLGDEVRRLVDALSATPPKRRARVSISSSA